MAEVIISLKRSPRGNVKDILKESLETPTEHFNGLLFEGLYDQPFADRKEGQGSTCIYRLTRNGNQRTYHGRVFNELNEYVADMRYTVPSGDYEFFVLPDFVDDNLYIRFNLKYRRLDHEQG